MGQIGIFDESKALGRLSKLGDKLEWLNAMIHWDLFLPLLNQGKPDHTKTRKGGRPPLPNLLMFKILILQELHSLSDEMTEFYISDRLTWRRFLGMSLSDAAPDRTSIWLFREILKESGVYEDLFNLFKEKMEQLGVITHKGNIVDASFVDVPRQRNTREENKVIKEGGVPEGWETKESANMLAQKDIDATWAKKNEEVHYGYKDHVMVDAESKLIVEYRVSEASLHDSKRFVELVGDKVREIWADSAYMSKGISEWFAKNRPDIKLHINEKGCKNHPLTDEQKQNNRERSRISSRVEHVFGHISNAMGGMFIRTIGFERAECVIGLKNLAYNLSRYASLARFNRAPRMA